MKNILLLLISLFLQTFLSAAPAPDFTVPTSDGQVRKLYQDYVNQQKLVVLEIFFTTCPPCASHAPYWQALYLDMIAAHPGKVEFMLLSPDTSHAWMKSRQEDKITRWLTDHSRPMATYQFAPVFSALIVRQHRPPADSQPVHRHR